VTSQDYVININDPWKCYSDFIDHALPKDSVSPHGASRHARVQPHHLNPELHREQVENRASESDHVCNYLHLI